METFLAGKPSAHIGVNHMSVDMGSSLSINCTTTGNPKPSIEWKKYGGSLPSGSRILANSTTLRLNRMEKEHGGMYICKVTNPLGVSISSVFVSVKG